MRNMLIALTLAQVALGKITMHKDGRSVSEAGSSTASLYAAASATAGLSDGASRKALALTVTFSLFFQ